ncbi:MAG: hypothetical protein OZSIB_0596 [Candidatus Ozemobacter sibiricus]|uniref:Uncharacterized protein n=1 Tax=Candidatus Ozemobacter sibiricus TaxID=2268124 RepID=A0A367ZVS9_9BACT|nr:MAG: hypothetical protein OZSIB_0596 [Candidatus Ozemobacter sibiricus]
MSPRPSHVRAYSHGSRRPIRRARSGQVGHTVSTRSAPSPRARCSITSRGSGPAARPRSVRPPRQSHPPPATPESTTAVAPACKSKRRADVPTLLPGQWAVGSASSTGPADLAGGRSPCSITQVKGSVIRCHTVVSSASRSQRSFIRDTAAKHRRSAMTTRSGARAMRERNHVEAC